MSVDDQQWQRKNIEGSLFLIKRRSQPRFQMLVLNKLSTGESICIHVSSPTTHTQAARCCCSCCPEQACTYIAGTDNYIETVHGGLEMETNPPYLMYTHGNDEVRAYMKRKKR
jgi:mRNA-decapping enzyme 1B